MATKDQNKSWPNASEDAGWLYRWAALGLPVTVTHKAPEPVQAGNMPAEESKSANQEARAVPPEAANKQELSGRMVIQDPSLKVFRN